MKQVIRSLKDIFNDNRYIAGIAMIFFTIGSKYLKIDVNKNIRKILNSKLFKNLTIFSIFYIGSRDILASITLTIVFIILTDGFFNANSKYFILPNSFKDDHYTKKEYELSKEIIKGYEKEHNIDKSKIFCS